MSILKRSDFDAIKLRRVEVPAPEISKDAAVLVQEPDGATGEALQAADYPVGDDGAVRVNNKGKLVRWAIACVVDETGTPIWTDADTAIVGKLPGALLRRIMAAANKFAGASTAEVNDEAGNS